MFTAGNSKTKFQIFLKFQAQVSATVMKIDSEFQKIQNQVSVQQHENMKQGRNPEASFRKISYR
jgi:hypothetical protein